MDRQTQQYVKKQMLSWSERMSFRECQGVLEWKSPVASLSWALGLGVDTSVSITVFLK